MQNLAELRSRCNAFTPNPNGGSGGDYDPNDLGNDVFYPSWVREGFQDADLQPLGEAGVRGNDVLLGWDGYYRGQLSHQDVYVYQMWITSG
ncbi:MAG: hypothetical protein IPN38_17310 [Flavobacteriales bacterium]|nr:hypothetical protein [Flavobacteriales bacterium]